MGYRRGDEKYAEVRQFLPPLLPVPRVKDSREIGRYKVRNRHKGGSHNRRNDKRVARLAANLIGLKSRSLRALRNVSLQS